MWWNSVKELIEYARTEKPDAYEIVRMANKIADEFNASKPPTTNDESIQWYVRQT